MSLPPPLEGARVLLVDDDDHVRRALTTMLRRAGAKVHALPDAVHALAAIASERTDIVLTNLHMPHIDGLELLRTIREARQDVEVVLMTGHATVDVAVQALKHGAYDFLTKPLPDAAQVVALLGRAAERHMLRRRNVELQAALGDAPQTGLVGRSDGLRRVQETIASVAPFSTTVLIQGESGTGKEIVARAVHAQSPRAQGPWVALNCSALPEALLESELFGHVKGAFTGANATRDGLFQAASGGTIFLDEIGELPLALQAKLLRVLQESEVRKVGGNASERVDVRVIAATNVDLKKAVGAGRFREDLYYRLDVVAVVVPPLRERMDDVPLLAAHFLRRHAARTGQAPLALSPALVTELTSRPWPGNVRELENALERVMVLAGGDRPFADVRAALGDAGRDTTATGTPRRGAPAALLDLPMMAAREAALVSFERTYLEARLERAAGNVSEAARAAGMDRANFRRALKRYGIEASKFLRS